MVFRRMWQQGRGYLRLGGFVMLCAAQVLLWLVSVWLPGRAACRQAQAQWLHHFCRRILRLLGVQVRYAGTPPVRGLLVCNHLSYLDIVVLAAHQPTVFVSKQEVRSWPGLGPLVVLAGTLFVDRERRADVARAGVEIAAALAGAVPLCIFPEGTSSDGSTVLPFRSSLLAPAVETGYPITPAWLGYTMAHGSPAQEACYWGTMTFLPHFLHLLGQGGVTAHVRYGRPITGVGNRKAAAVRLRDEVIRLGASRG